MKKALMILTLCVTLVGTANALTFVNVTPQDFQGDDYSVVAWGDVDGNGYTDLFVGAQTDGRSRLFLNHGMDWLDGSDVYEISSIHNVTSARFVDFNQDGMLDLLCLTNNESGVELFRQTANMRFQSVELNLDEATGTGIHSAMWCDANDDGSLDLVLSNRSSNSVESVLLVPSADEFIEDRGSDGPFAMTGAAAMSCIDFDHDGDLDYLMSNTLGYSNLWISQDGGYFDYGYELELPVKMGQEGLTWGDFNHDGLLDFYACGTPDNSCLYYQRPAGPDKPCSFEEMTDQFDLRPLTSSVSNASAIDYNGDGWTDLFLTSPHGNFLLQNDHGRSWIQRQVETRIQELDRGTNSVAWADYDNDGDLDVVMAQGANGVKLLRNDASLIREFVCLNLCGSGESMAPELNCLVEVHFPYGKQWAATSMYTSSNSGDDMRQTVFNRSYLHSEEWTVHVMWSNGVITTLNQDQVPLNGVVTLHMPIADAGENQTVVAPLEQPEVRNYPNPFNPMTNISFNLNESAYITLSIFNLLGQEVATLASGQYEAGQHSLVFDATALPSGLYMARLESPVGSVVHRMLLTK
jgi:hypothetical protein